jgi:glycolate oxidase FAD binding subunit
MNSLIEPASVNELAEIVRNNAKLVASGAGTKSRLTEVNGARVSVSKLRGIIEYEPSEFTFTARAGTPIRELVQVLAERGQYLPFEPVLVEGGATLGGTVAAGVSGPGRLRFGGMRDFILGAQFIDGLGRALRVGGKVVKNAAGFDLPKFFVGSLGRFGLLTEVTFKVFPVPSSSLTLRLSAPNIEAATNILVEAAKARWEVHALDIVPGTFDICARLGGPAKALQEISHDILRRWPGEVLHEDGAEKTWTGLKEFIWAYPTGPLIKIVLTPSALPACYRGLQSLDGARIHVSCGGNQAFVSLPESGSASRLDAILRELSLRGMTLRGPGQLWWGLHSRPEITRAVKQALDPQNRFAGLEE